MGWLDKLFGRSNAPDPAETFGRPVARALHEAGFPNPIAFDPEKFEITLGEDRTLDLQNYYQDFLADDSDFDSVFERIKATLDSESMVPKTFEEARPNLIPVIREKVYLDRSGCGAIGTADEPGAIPRKTLNQDLAVTVIWNGEEAFFTQTFRGYEAWGVDFDEAYAAAMENLKRQSFEPFVEDKQGVMVLEDAGGFAPSALLRPDVLAGAGISGTPVVMMPRGNTLLMADSNNEEGLRHMVEIVWNLVSEKRPLSGFSYVADGDGWRHFPSRDEETVEDLRQFNTQWLAKIYDNQKAEIEAVQQKSLNEDNFELMEIDWLFALPVSVTLVENKERVFTACPWGKDSELLLPESDYVFFVDFEGEDEDGCIVAWEEVRRAFGRLMTPVGLNPERYYVTESPEDEELKRVKTEFD